MTGTDERLDVLDAILRFAAGQDFGDRELYESAFSVGAVLDFRQPAARFGAEVPLMEGRATIMDVAFTATSDLTTTHTVTNPRVEVTEDGAHLTALVAAQHVRADGTEHLLLKNVYEVRLSRGDGDWRIDHLRIENLWFEGRPGVLFGDVKEAV